MIPLLEGPLEMKIKDYSKRTKKQHHQTPTQVLLNLDLTSVRWLKTNLKFLILLFPKITPKEVKNLVKELHQLRVKSQNKTINHSKSL